MKRTTICALLIPLAVACGSTDSVESITTTTTTTAATAITETTVVDAEPAASDQTTTTAAPMAEDADDQSDVAPPESTESSDDGALAISSEAIVDGALLEAFACERKDNGVEASIPLAWSGVPAEAGSLAITMHHFPRPDDPTEVNSYLTLWDIDASVTGIAHGEASEGEWFQGSNKDGNAISYTSPCSPDDTGNHEYTITLYALSDTPPSLPDGHAIAIDRTALVESLESVTIVDVATLTFTA